MRLLIAGAALVAAASALDAAQVGDEQAKLFPARVLAAHNRVRASIGASPLQWDDQLGRSAALYAVALAYRNEIAHSDQASRPNTGENLWMGTHGAYSVEDMVGGWSSERQLFIAGKFPQVSRSGTWHDVGHYTQMVWPTTRKVGCALASSRNSDVLVCRYFPAGNVMGQPVVTLVSH